MAMNSEKLMEAAQLEPDGLGAKIVDPLGDDQAQFAQAIAWLDNNVLPGAISEVSIPFMSATGFTTVDDFINLASNFASLSTAAKDALKSQGGDLWDFCVKSFGRSEINKTIDSNSKDYDSDSDQDRIQGEQRLKKLLEWARVLLATSGGGAGVSTGSIAGGNATNTQSIPTIHTW